MLKLHSTSQARQPASAIDLKPTGHSITHLNPDQKTERFYLKFVLGGIGVLLFLIVGIWGGNRAFRRWQEHRFMQQAHAFIERGNDVLAATAAHRAYELNPGDAEACRLLATISERGGQAGAVEWRRRAYDLQPNSMADALAYAKTSLKFGDKVRARGVLEKISREGENSASYHETAAQLAISDKDPAAAEAHFAAAARLEPETKKYALNLGVFHLQSPDAETRTAALNELSALMKDEGLRLPATRALLEYAIQRRDLPAVIDIASHLQSYPEAGLHDRMVVLPILRQVDQDAFAVQLAKIQNYAANDPALVAELTAWMSANQMAILALDWIKRLPPDLLLMERVPLSVSDCYAALLDWAGLQSWCKKQTWRNYDYLRRAYLARAARELGNELDNESEWNAAIKEASSNGESIGNLARVVIRWGWKKEGEALLWRLVDDPQSQPAALTALHQYYSEAEDTPNLYRVAMRASDAHPEDLTAANNAGQLSLLLNLNPDRGRTTARRLYERDPANPIFASTQAFALYSQDKFKDALKVMNALPSEQLREPSIAAYYGLILAATGDNARAREFIELGEKAKLLPEEKALLSKAKSRLPSP